MASSTSKSNTPWSKRLDARLVRQVQRRRCLWDPAHQHYTSAARRNQAYSVLASKYGPHISAETVKERWLGIHSTFTECLRKLEASRIHAPDTEPTEPSWHLWKACTFMMDVKNSGKTSGKTELLDEKIKTEAASDVDEEDSEFLLKADDANDCTDGDKPKALKVPLDCNDIVQGLMTAFRGVQNGTFGEQNNEFDKVGRLVSKTLSRMSSYEAAQTSSKIMEILLLYHEDNPQNPNNQLDLKDYLEES